MMDGALFKDVSKATGAQRIAAQSFGMVHTGLWGRHTSSGPPIYFNFEVGVAQTDFGVAQFQVGVAHATPT